MQNYDFACCFVWVWNVVCDTKQKLYFEGVWGQLAEEKIWF